MRQTPGPVHLSSQVTEDVITTKLGLKKPELCDGKMHHSCRITPTVPREHAPCKAPR